MRGQETEQEVLDTWVRNLVAVMQRGLKLKPACRALKIPYTTMIDWKAKSEVVRTELESAEAIFELTLTKTVYDGAEKDPRLALEVLKSRFRDTWASRTDITSGDEPISGYTFEIIDKTEDVEDEKEENPGD